MRFRVRPESDQPIYEQITAQVIYAVAEGALAPGELIPSVRELAEQLLVNPNTVARAYQELERQGVVESRRGRGMEVTAAAPAACAKKRIAFAEARIRAALDEAIGSGMDFDAVRGLVDKLLRNGQASRRGKSATD